MSGAFGGAGPVIPMPAWMVEALTTPPPPPPPPAARPSSSWPGSNNDSAADWYAEDTSWLELLGRHRWVQLDAEGTRWKHPTATSDLSATVTHNCLFVYSPNTPFEPTGASNPKGYTLFHAYAVLDFGGDMSAAGRAVRDRMPKTVDDLSWIPAGNGNRNGTEAPHVPPEGAGAGSGAEGGPAPIDALQARVVGLRSGLLSIVELSELPAPTPLVDDVLWSNTLACIYGKPASAKTFVALDWALCVATGTRWHGRKVTQARVLWVAAEGAEGVYQRAWAWMVEHQTPTIGPDQFVVYPQPVNLFDPKQAAALAALAAEEGFGLVIVDTLARASLGAEENSARDMGLVVEAADSVRRACQAAVLLVHHTARNGENPRGSTAIEGAAYTMWKTELEADTVRLVNDKAKESAKERPIFLKMVERARSVVLHRATGTPEGLTEGPRQLLRLLAEMADDSGVPQGLWQRTAIGEGVAERSFYRWHKGLNEQGFTVNVGTDRQKRWTLTALGAAAAEEEGETSG